MSFTSLPIKISYSSDSDHLIEDFYIPCLRHTKMYYRAVGYFSSYSLAHVAEGIACLLKNGGKICLIASPALSLEDIEAIHSGYQQRDDVIHKRAIESFDNITNTITLDRLDALSWLIKQGQLDIKLAIRTDEDGRLSRGIFHEKMGIFLDDENNAIAFSGSNNETQGGLVDNFETTDVFWSWDDSFGRVNTKIERFERLWNNTTSGLSILAFTDVATKILEQYQQDTPPVVDQSELYDQDIIIAPSDESLSLPSHITLRDYQKEAINNWFKNNGCGTFKMATGTGKTITALGLATHLDEKIELEALVIICPYRHLVTQWKQECQAFGISPILAMTSRKQWETELSSQLYGVLMGISTFLSVITTNKTFSSAIFQEKLEQFPQKTLLIADEVHNLGAKKLRAMLPDSIRFRLGLSATPERWFDEEGTESLFQYFGKVLEPQLSIKDALKQKVLTPYRYYPLLIALTDTEHEEYIALSAKIGKAFAFSKTQKDDEIMTALLVKRARLIASAHNKLTALKKLMEEMKDQEQMLFYCGDGTVEDPIDASEQRQIEAVLSILGYEMGMKVAPYTAETSLEERERLKVQLASGELQGLVAIRCLDEGVDIPSIKTAIILASSRNPRQFIQRRGRVLRSSAGKNFANIYDMIVISPDETINFSTERSLLKNELIRFIEFSDLALNNGIAREKILELQKKFNLMDL